MKSENAATATTQHTPEIRTRSGLVVELIGRRSVTSVWARRVTDNALRDYWHSELICDGGAEQLIRAIAVLPLVRKARAEAAIAAATKGAR